MRIYRWCRQRSRRQAQVLTHVIMEGSYQSIVWGLASTVSDHLRGLNFCCKVVASVRPYALGIFVIEIEPYIRYLRCTPK